MLVDLLVITQCIVILCHLQTIFTTLLILCNGKHCLRPNSGVGVEKATCTVSTLAMDSLHYFNPRYEQWFV